jgi:hypothetical protein
MASEARAVAELFDEVDKRLGEPDLVTATAVSDRADS